MNGRGSLKFSAVAFDLDGTLYPDLYLFVRLVPFLIKDHRLLMAMNKARIQLRQTGLYEGDFYRLQARIMGEILNEEPETVRERTEHLIYRGWEPFFKKISLFPHVRETLDAFRKAGIKMGLLSDFPPEIKLKNLNISEYWDVVLCSEHTGRLKPDKKPFLDLAALMGMPPGEILYVGNSVPYDVKGARSMGMKAAHIRPRWKKYLPAREVDFIFYDYRQLRDYVLS